MPPATQVEAADTLDTEGEEEPREPIDRSRDLLGGVRSKVRKHLEKLTERIGRGFEDQAERSNNQQDCWNAWFCKLDGNQIFNGDSQAYWPIIRDAVEARATRFSNQLFPQSNRLIDAITTDGKTPFDVLALLEHYVRARKFKTRVVKPLSICGDIEGQYNLYVDWNEVERLVATRQWHGVTVNQDGRTVEIPGEEIEDIDEEEIREGQPIAEVLHDSDVLILPASADTNEEALEAGGVVVIVRRWSETKIERMIAAGEINKPEGKEVLDLMKAAQKSHNPDIEKKLNEAVGISAKGQMATVWEVWHKLKLNDKGLYDEDGKPRLCRIWVGPERLLLGAKRNPYWSDRCPLLSEPVKKIPGQRKGQSLVEPLLPMQWNANDAVNESGDTDHRSAMPIVLADQSKVTGPLILDIGAIWNADPASIKIIEFPDLNPRAVMRVQEMTRGIFQSLGINPAMLPQQTGRPGAKRNQAEIALEQQVDLMQTSEQVSTLQEMASDTMSWWLDLDHQFRNDDMMVRQYGAMGVDAILETVNPIRNRKGIEVRWMGVELARNVAQIQTMTAAFATLKQFRQELQQEGYGLRIGPLAEVLSMSAFGAVAGSKVLLDLRHQLSLDPELENTQLAEGFNVPVQAMDEDAAHLKSHIQARAERGDPSGMFTVHIMQHQQAMKMKAMAMMMQQVQQAMQGQPQGQQGRPGMRPGAQPAPPRQPQRPNGMIRTDNLPGAGALTMPRRM